MSKPKLVSQPTCSPSGFHPHLSAGITSSHTAEPESTWSCPVASLPPPFPPTETPFSASGKHSPNA